MEDYYDLLGVGRDASTAEIKQAYRERIKEVHPDVSDEEAASERTKTLIRAKDTLTDPDEREQYDRLGHEAYVGGAEATSEGAESSDEPPEEPTAATAGAGESESTADASETAAGTTTDTQSATGTATDQRQDYSAGTQDWYDGTSGDPAGASGGTSAGRSPAWDPGRSYEVERESGNLSGLDIFSSQRSLVLLLSTFAVYPVLLFGSLSPQFPLAVNLIVAGCTILVIAFLQSVPSVGMVVFGAWTLLLPPILVLWIGISPFSLYGVLAITGVSFPCFLSALTWYAIRPMSIT